jgi:hypothetical protein
MPYDKSTNVYTFKCGRSAKISHISHYLLNELTKQFAAPKPPRQVVELVGGVTEEIENTAHPDYIEALRIYREELAERWRKLVLIRGVELDIDRSAVKALRSDMEQLSVTLPDDDAYVYLYYLCIGSQTEEQDLINVIHGYSYATEESIASATNSF